MRSLIAYLYVLGALMTWCAFFSLETLRGQRLATLGIAVTWPASVPFLLTLGGIGVAVDVYQGKLVKA